MEEDSQHLIKTIGLFDLPTAALIERHQTLSVANSSDQRQDFVLSVLASRKTDKCAMLTFTLDRLIETC